MSTNMASKFIFRKNCINFLFFRNVYRINRRPYLFLRDVKERRACYVGVPFKETYFYDRHASDSHGSQQGSPYVFAVLGVVCAAGANSEDTREHESAISGINQDVTPPISRHFSVRSANGRFGNRKPPKNIGPMREGLKAWTVKRKLVLENSTDENEPPSKCQTRTTKVKYNSPSIALVYAKKNKSSWEVSNLKSHVMNFLIGCCFTRRVYSTWNPPD